MSQEQKEKLYEIIFEADTPTGKVFDISLLVAIVISVVAVILESVPEIGAKYDGPLHILEWIITGIFTFEYVTRIWIVRRPFKYIFSFYGIVDLLSILPTFLALFVTGTQSIMVVRALRLLRVFRILKLPRYINEASIIWDSLVSSRRKIGVFMFAVLMIVIIMGTVMYLIEGKANGFTSIPKSMYWTIVTLTTVGYGDMAPSTNIGQFLASILMVLGYAIIAVPTGIVTSEIISTHQVRNKSTQCCPQCLHEDHESDAKYCKYCGSEINPQGGC